MSYIRELRKLAQAATPGGWYVEGGCIYGCKDVTDGEEEWRPVIAHPDDDEPVNYEGNAAFIAAANPAAILDLLDRLEAAEEAITEAYQRGYSTGQEEIEKEYQHALEVKEAYQAYQHQLNETEEERDALRAKIEQMEKQDPAAYLWTSVQSGDIEVTWDEDAFDREMWHRSPLYTTPGAQNVPSKPEGWLRAIDEALVVAHIGVANESDTYEQAKVNLNNLICFHIDIATDPAVNGGYKLVPVAFALYSGWARKAVYLTESEACDQRDRRQLTADLGGSLEAYRVVPLYLAPGAKGEEK